MNTIGKTIKEIRKNKRITQRSLSEASGVTIATICAYETGKYTPNTDTVSLLLNALGCELCIREKPAARSYN